MGPFNLVEAFQIKPFTTHQMIDFFKQIEGCYRFRDSTRQAIMEYSAGAPGVVGSLIQFLIDHCKYDQERHEWEHWLKIQNFSLDLHRYNWTYDKIRGDLQQLSESDWKLLGLLLKDDVRGYSAVFSPNRDKLVQMGVVTDGADSSELRFSSEMMRRLCLEAVPIREIDIDTSADDPLELLVVSLQFMKPALIREVKSGSSPSKVAFQFELYASIRGIFKTTNTSHSVLAEARDFYDSDNRRLDLIVSNRTKYGYELKSNVLRESAIKSAAQQAGGYRQLLNIDTMFLVKFLPQSHTVQRVYDVGYPDVKILYVFFPGYL
ncbi:hypothetical protein V7S43_013142 [Phytophthora oleae]